MKDPNKNPNTSTDGPNVTSKRESNLGHLGMNIIEMQNRVGNEIKHYEDEFENYVYDWVSAGVSQTLADGKFDDDIKADWAKKGFDTKDIAANTDSHYAQRGFSLLERDKIRHNLGLDENMSYEALQAEKAVTNAIGHDIANTMEIVDPDEVDRAKLDGVLRNVRMGAKVVRDEFGETVQFLIPPENKRSAWIFMTNMGLNFIEYKEGSETVEASHEGFANIVKTISECKDEKTRETGAEMLDWYFDSFRFREHMEDFTDDMMGHYAVESKAWKDAYDDYTERRSEFKEFYERQKKVPEMVSVEQISEEEFYKLMSEEAGDNFDRRNIPTFDKVTRAYDMRVGAATETPHRTPEAPNFIPAGLKRKKLLEEYQGIKAIDEDATVHRAVFKEKSGKPKQYIGLRFGMHGKNIIIFAPIQEASSDASYTWAGETGMDRDGWKSAFMGPSDDNGARVKGFIRHNGEIGVHTHKANKKYQLDGVQNMWYNIWKDIERRVSASE